MDTGILEIVRSLYADIERHYADIVNQMLFKCDHAFYEILRDHYIVKKLKEIENTADRLQDLYGDDEDLVTANNEEINVANAIRNFESAVARLREYNRLHKLPPWKEETDTVASDSYEMMSLVQFSHAEKFGRCLDLAPHYQRYLDFMSESARCSVKGRPLEEQLTFLNYARSIAGVHKGIGTQRKMVASATYKDYATQLLEYLIDFYGRIKPLKVNTMKAALRSADQKFEDSWKAAKIPSWREFRSNTMAKEIAKCESRAEQVLSILSDFIECTTSSLQNQLSRSPEEIMRELELQEKAFHDAFDKALDDCAKATKSAVATAEDYDEGQLDAEQKREQAKFANVKSVPLDSDGTPIATWLYKLHQLDKKFVCQICGGEVYRGPKVFTEHFQEMRHTEGLARLGIRENLDEYRLITSCAKALSRKRELDAITSRKRLRSGDEEVEDPLGVVMTQRSINEYRRNFARRH